MGLGGESKTKQELRRCDEDVTTNIGVMVELTWS